MAAARFSSLDVVHALLDGGYGAELSAVDIKDDNCVCYAKCRRNLDGDWSTQDDWDIWAWLSDAYQMNVFEERLQRDRCYPAEKDRWEKYLRHLNDGSRRDPPLIQQ